MWEGRAIRKFCRSRFMAADLLQKRRERLWNMSFIWTYFSSGSSSWDLLALYLASCFGRIPRCGSRDFWLQRQPEASATASLLCFLSFRQRQSFFSRRPGSEASCAGWLFTPGTPGELLKGRRASAGGGLYPGREPVFFKRNILAYGLGKPGGGFWSGGHGGSSFKRALRERERGRERFLVRLFYRGEQESSRPWQIRETGSGSQSPEGR